MRLFRIDRYLNCTIKGYKKGMLDVHSCPKVLVFKHSCNAITCEICSFETG